MGYCTMIGFGSSFRTQSFEDWAVIHLVTPTIDIPRKGSSSIRGWLLKWALTVTMPTEVPDPQSTTYNKLVQWASRYFVTAEE